MRHAYALLAGLVLLSLSNQLFSQKPTNSKEKSSIYVEPVTLTEVIESSGINLNIGAVTSNPRFAEGIQKAADVYGLKLDIFVSADPAFRQTLINSLIQQNNSYIIADELQGENLSLLQTQARSKKIGFLSQRVSQTEPGKQFDLGFDALKEARASLLKDIPKYDQVLPIAFPISPMPDDFFQPSKFPYPSPLVRVPRTNESRSASVHAHTSCNMVAQTGNMLHHTSSNNPNLLLMGMEGGNLSLAAMPGAIDKAKISSVMTSWVLKMGKEERTQVLVENNGIESSLFTNCIHAPEELITCLEKWKLSRKITDYQVLDNDKVLIKGWDGKDRLLKGGLFLVANDRFVNGPAIEEGVDVYGAKAIDFYSTQMFVQQLVEILDTKTPLKNNVTPQGGILTKAGATVGNYFGASLQHFLIQVPQVSSPVQPYILKTEGGFMTVTPEAQGLKDLDKIKVNGFYIDLRGPLTSDQTINVITENHGDIVFRRTIINFDELNAALNSLKTMGLISGWDFEGVRGQGLFANVIVYDFLGKNRKFMSSLCVWPTDEKVEHPVVRFYVDGMQRLNFGFLTKGGWRQEFVEVPLRIPPVPRDIDLYSGQSTLK